MLLNIFSNDAFSLTSLTDTINHLPHKAGRLGDLGLFYESGISTQTAVIESKNGQLHLLPTRERGAPAPQAQGMKRDVRSFVIPHIPYESTIMADEVQNVRAFGSESTFQGVQAVVNERLSEMIANHEITLEYLRIGALKGVILDADGKTIIYNLYGEFQVEQQIHDMGLNDPNADIRTNCVHARRKVDDALGADPYTGLRAFCSASFYDKLVAHPYVRDSYQRYQAGELLRNDPKSGFLFGDIRFEEYRGHVDGIPFIPDGEAYLIPEGTRLFKTFFAPATFMETVNTIGLPKYAKQKVLDYNVGVQLHTQSNPLPICLKPRAVIKLVMGAAPAA